MQMKFRVYGTGLKIAEPFTLVATQVQYDTCSFSFDASWTGYAKTAVFYSDSTTRTNVLLDENDTCVIPWEKVLNSGVLYIGVFGIKDTSVIPTNFVQVPIEAGSYLEGEDPLPPTPDVYKQIITAYSRLLYSALPIPKSPVTTFADIATTYPAPEVAWTVKTLDDGKIYKYDGTSWVWTDTITSSSYDALLSQIGNMILNTISQTLSGAVNELKLNIDELTEHKINSGYSLPESPCLNQIFYKII